MKGHRVFVLLVGVVSFAEATAQAPEGPEYDLLRALVGEYTYEYTEMGAEMPGRISYTLFDGGRFVLFDEEYDRTDGLVGRIHGIVGYDEAAGAYTWYRCFNNGAWDYARGQRDGDSIVFEMIAMQWEPFGDENLNVPGARQRTIWSGIGTDQWTFRWERSIDGGPWEQTAEGTASPVR